MAASIYIYDSFKEYMADGLIDMDGDTFKVALVSSTYTPAPTHTKWADVSTYEATAANGYSAGGLTMGNTEWTRTTGTVKFDATDSVWTASGGSITARYAVIYDDTVAATATDALVAYVLLDTSPANVTATTGNTLTLQWNSSGIFTLSGGDF